VGGAVCALHAVELPQGATGGSAGGPYTMMLRGRASRAGQLFFHAANRRRAKTTTATVLYLVGTMSVCSSTLEATGRPARE
jgi:hypothetical protein